MPNYSIDYTFNGEGYMTIEADSKEEAEERFYNGGSAESTHEFNDNHLITNIKED